MNLTIEEIERGYNFAISNVSFVRALRELGQYQELPEEFADPPPIKSKTITIRLPFLNSDIVAGVALAFGMTKEYMTSGCRRRNTANAKRVAAKLLRDNGLSYPNIAKLLSMRDHSSIIYLVETFDAYAARDEYIANVYRAFRKGMDAPC